MDEGHSNPEMVAHGPIHVGDYNVRLGPDWVWHDRHHTVPV